LTWHGAAIKGGLNAWVGHEPISIAEE
jgi:hypothetical protein